MTTAVPSSNWDDESVVPRRGYRIAELLASADADERRLGVQMLQDTVKTSRCSIVWLLYLEYLHKATGSLQAPVWRAALDAAGCDPLAFPLWKFVVDLLESSLNAAVASPGAGVPTATTVDLVRGVYRRALSVPLAGHEYGGMIATYERFEREVAKREGRQAPSSVPSEVLARHQLAREMWAVTERLWPDRFAFFSDESAQGAALHMHTFSVLLQTTFAHQLRPESALPPNLFTQRVGIMFELQLASHPTSAPCWLQYGVFAAGVLGRDPALAILRRARAALGCVPVIEAALARLQGAATATDSISAMSGVDEVSKLAVAVVVDPLESGDAKKAFRAIGKQAMQQRRTDWQLYHLWADLEALVRDDVGFAAEVWDRCLDHVRPPTTRDSAFMLMHAADFYASRNDEVKLKPCIERAVKQADASGETGIVRDFERRLQRDKARFGDPYERTPPSAVADTRGPTPTLRLLSRYQYCLSFPCDEQDLLVVAEARDLREALFPTGDDTNRGALRGEMLDAPAFAPGMSATAPIDEEVADIHIDQGDPTASLPWLAPLTLPKRSAPTVTAPTSVSIEAAVMGFSGNAAPLDDVVTLDGIVGPRSLEGVLHAPLELSEVTRQRMQRDEDRRNACRDRAPTAVVKDLPLELRRLEKLLSDAHERASHGSTSRLPPSPYERVNARWLMNFFAATQLNMRAGGAAADPPHSTPPA